MRKGKIRLFLILFSMLLLIGSGCFFLYFRMINLSHEEIRHINLKELVDRDVTLKGTLWSLNGNWWFEADEERIYLVDESGSIMHFSDKHGAKAEVKGRLVRQLRPSLLQISLKSDRDLIPTYVIRNATITWIEASKTWRERFGPVYPKYNIRSIAKSSDGLKWTHFKDSRIKRCYLTAGQLKY